MKEKEKKQKTAAKNDKKQGGQPAEKKRNDTLAKLLPIVLILAGITVLGAGLTTLLSQAGRIRTDAVIAEIAEESYSYGGRQKKTVSALATYTLDGVSYTADLGGVKNGFIEGGGVAVLVDPDVPQDAVLPQTTGGAVCTGIGAALLLAGLVWFFPLFRSILSNGRKRNDPIPVE